MPTSQDEHKPGVKKTSGQEISRSGVAAAVILFRPSPSEFINIASYADQVDEVIVIDDSPPEYSTDESEITRYSNAVYLSNHANLGIAASLNRAARHARQLGYQWLLTMDQDSTATDHMVEQLLECAERTENVGLVSPVHQQVGGSPPIVGIGCHDALTVMTSGNLVSLDALFNVGLFLEDLFIDQVDNEICLRMQVHGYRVVEMENVILFHRVGAIKRHIFPWPAYSSNHAPFRRYYMTRNRFRVTRLYGSRFPEFFRFERMQVFKDIVKICLYERKKRIKLAYMLRGYFDYRAGRAGCMDCPSPEMRPKTLIFLLNTMRIGGSQTVFRNLALMARASGWDVMMMSRGGETESALLSAGVEIIRSPLREGTAWDAHEYSGLRRILVGMSDLRGSLSLLHSAVLLRSAMRGRECVLHASQPWPTALAALVGRLASSPVIWHVHGTLPVEMPPALSRLSLRWIDSIIAVSPEVEHTIETLVPPGVDLRWLTSPVSLSHHAALRVPAQSGLRLSTCSTLTDNKKAYLMACIEAAELLADQGLVVHLTIIGDGPCRSDLEAHANIFQTTTPSLNIVFTGATASPEDWYTLGDIFIGMGMAALEAAFLGLSVICASSEGYGGILDVETYTTLQTTNFTGRGMETLDSTMIAKDCLRVSAGHPCGELLALIKRDYGEGAFKRFDMLWDELARRYYADTTERLATIPGQNEEHR